MYLIIREAHESDLNPYAFMGASVLLIRLASVSGIVDVYKRQHQAILIVYAWSFAKKAAAFFGSSVVSVGEIPA